MNTANHHHHHHQSSFNNMVSQWRLPEVKSRTEFSLQSQKSSISIFPRIGKECDYKDVCFFIGNWIYGAFPNRDYNSFYSAVINSRSLQSITTRTEIFESAVLHQSSGTSSQRPSIPFLVSRTVPVSQPEQLLTRSEPTYNSNAWNCLHFHRLRPPIMSTCYNLRCNNCCTVRSWFCDRLSVDRFVLVSDTPYELLTTF
jgi:hypothetical protein